MEKRYCRGVPELDVSPKNVIVNVQWPFLFAARICFTCEFKGEFLSVRLFVLNLKIVRLAFSYCFSYEGIFWYLDS